jgi:hypothetical protein
MVREIGQKGKVIGLALGAVALVAVYALLVRPYHVQWGATDAEVERALPGDARTPNPQMLSTRAITIQAPVSEVWPWLAQLGQGRAGFYTYHWLEDLFWANMDNADEIQPELQELAVGDHISLMENGPALEVRELEIGRGFVLSTGWTYWLEPVGEDTTRLIVRSRATWEPGALNWFYYHAVYDPAHFVMEVGMLQGIKARAEGARAASLSGEPSHGALLLKEVGQ